MAEFTNFIYFIYTNQVVHDPKVYIVISPNVIRRNNLEHCFRQFLNWPNLMYVCTGADISSSSTGEISPGSEITDTQVLDNYSLDTPCYRMVGDSVVPAVVPHHLHDFINSQRVVLEHVRMARAQQFVRDQLRDLRYDNDDFIDYDNFSQISKVANTCWQLGFHGLQFMKTRPPNIRRPVLWVLWVRQYLDEFSYLPKPFEMEDLVGLFVEEGLAIPLLRVAIVGARQSFVCSRKFHPKNEELSPNLEAVKMLMPRHVAPGTAIALEDNSIDRIDAVRFWYTHQVEVEEILSLNGSYRDSALEQSIIHYFPNNSTILSYLEMFDLLVPVLLCLSHLYSYNDVENIFGTVVDFVCV